MATSHSAILASRRSSAHYPAAQHADVNKLTSSACPPTAECCRRWCWRCCRPPHSCAGGAAACPAAAAPAAHAARGPPGQQRPARLHGLAQRWCGWVASDHRLCIACIPTQLCLRSASSCRYSARSHGQSAAATTKPPPLCNQACPALHLRSGPPETLPPPLCRGASAGWCLRCRRR